MSEELLKLKTKRIAELEAADPLDATITRTVNGQSESYPISTLIAMLEAENARLKKSAREDMEEFDAVTARCIETLGDDAPDFGTSLPYVDLICARLLAQTTKPEPSRLEIAAMLAAGEHAAFAREQDAPKTVENGADSFVAAADALIAAAKAVQP
jgi:hypothetical protein